MWSCDLIGGRTDYCNPMALLRLLYNLKNRISALAIGLDGSNKLENLRIKLNFYKIISYLVDRCNSPAPSRSRQTLEKNVLSWALAWTGSVVFTRQVSLDTQLPYCACARMRTSSFCCLPSKVPLI